MDTSSSLTHAMKCGMALLYKMPRTDIHIDIDPWDSSIDFPVVKTNYFINTMKYQFMLVSPIAKHSTFVDFLHVLRTHCLIILDSDVILS